MVAKSTLDDLRERLDTCLELRASLDARVDKNLQQLSTTIAELEKDLMSIKCPTVNGGPPVSNSECDAPPEVLDPEQFTLALSDDFDSPTLDCSLWETAYVWTRERTNNGQPHLTINGEQQFYVDTCNGEDALYGSPFSIADSNLTITAMSMDGLPETTGGTPGGQPIRSGVITTERSLLFTYGYVEFKAKLPSSCGAWSAGWLLHRDYSFNNKAEIDIMEAPVRCDGNSLIDERTIQHAYHYTDSGNSVWSTGGFGTRQDFVTSPRVFGQCTGVVDTNLFAPANLNVLSTGGNTIGQTQLTDGSTWFDRFHTFGVKWTPGQIVYYVDGIPTATICEGAPGQTVYDGPMYFILNHAVGGDFPNDVPDASNYKDEFIIDYVKIWTLN